MSRPNSAYTLLLFLMTLLFGLTYIAAKYALQGLGVFQLIFARYAIAFVLLTAIFWKSRRRFRIHRNHWKFFALLTGIEPVGYFVFETFGIRYTSPSNVSLIIATIPIFALIFAGFWLKERPGWQAVAGMLICFMGVYLIVSLQEKNQLAPQPLLGNVLTLFAAMSAGLYNSVARKLTRTYSPLVLTYYQTLAASAVFLPMAIAEYFFKPNMFYVDWKIAGSVLYLALGASIGGYFILNFALSRLEAARVAVFSNFIPVITITASFLVYGETLKTHQFFGAALVMVGIFLTNTPTAFRQIAG